LAAAVAQAGAEAVGRSGFPSRSAAVAQEPAEEVAQDALQEAGERAGGRSDRCGGRLRRGGRRGAGEARQERAHGVEDLRDDGGRLRRQRGDDVVDVRAYGVEGARHEPLDGGGQVGQRAGLREGGELGGQGGDELGDRRLDAGEVLGRQLGRERLEGGDDGLVPGDGPGQGTGEGLLHGALGDLQAVGPGAGLVVEGGGDGGQRAGGGQALVLRAGAGREAARGTGGGGGGPARALDGGGGRGVPAAGEAHGAVGLLDGVAGLLGDGDRRGRLRGGLGAGGQEDERGEQRDDGAKGTHAQDIGSPARGPERPRRPDRGPPDERTAGRRPLAPDACGGPTLGRPWAVDADPRRVVREDGGVGDRAAAATWDRLAGRYARQEHLERRAIGVALDLLDAGPDDLVLDAATGTGLVLRELARRPAPPRRAVGVDRSAAMLAQAVGLPEGFALRRGELSALPLGDGEADCATASYVLHLLGPGERAAALAELRRVLCPGGRLVTLTPWAPRAAGRALLAAAARAPALGGLHPLDPRPELAAAGLEPVAARALGRGGYPSLVVLAARR
jgi:SAM-dependent methyltransferase